jgi:hypothetical protein
VQAEEVVAIVTSSLTLWLKRWRRYINCDCEAAHFKL